jgi:hypothetical protein
VADSAAQRHPHVIAGPSSDFTPGAVEQIDDTPPRNSSDTSLAGPTVRIPFAPPMSQLRTRLQHPSPNPMALRIVEQRSSLPAPGSPIRSSCETDPPLPEFAPDSLLEEAGFEPPVPPGKSVAFSRRREGRRPTGWSRKLASPLRGTSSSNPARSAGESLVRTGDIGNGT